LEPLSLSPWPSKNQECLEESAEIAVMGPEGAVEILEGKNARSIENPEEKEKFEKDIHEFLRPFIYSSTSCSRLRLLLRDLNPKWTMTFASYLHKIKVPSHLVWGSNDKVLNLNEARKLRGDLPQSTLTVLPNAGHLLPLEAPLELARIIHEFSRKIN
jgi:pimeloyl-ACP methyl ester carboxylesterase